MAIYAIADLHLSFKADKPMDIFGDNWVGYVDKIKENWKNLITDDDIVLIAGDVSWSLHFKDAYYDLLWIENLPGRKIISKGNHDYWWTSHKKMNVFETINFIHNNYADIGDYVICGSRGWICPNDIYFTEEDKKIYNREVVRLKNSLEAAKKDGYNKIICMIHYPPMNDKHESSGFTDLFEAYGVEKVVYGHLHSEECFKYGFQGMKNGVEYVLTSSDYLDFKATKII
jgi:predicted phosphohydrolase